MHARAHAGAAPQPVAVVQRACAACADKEESCPTCSGTVQRKPNGVFGGSAAPNSVADALRSPGRPLERSVRHEMEAGFGHDFSRVRVHVDDRATDALAARAFTLGNDVVFNTKEWAASRSDRRLLAHELAHVVQQEGRAAPPQAALAVGSSNDPAEHAADAAANRVIRGERAHVARLPTPVIRRSPSARDEEIAISLKSPGQYTASIDPVMVSIYNFGIDHVLLKPEHKEVVKEIHDLLELGVPGAVKIRVIGHADDTGDPDHNVKLSKQRANEAQGELGKPVEEISGKGDTEPVLLNDTPAGRTRNRRVDFLFEAGDITIEERKKKKRKKKKKKDKDDDDDWDWDIPNPCSGPIASKLCGLVGVGVVCMFIIPEICAFSIPWWWPFTWPKIPWPKRKKKPKDKDKKKDPPRAKACPTRVKLPSGPQEVQTPLELMVRMDAAAFFEMAIDFENDDENGCACQCGEYRQEVKGFFKTNGVTQKKMLSPTVELKENVFQEDGDESARPYGHRDRTGGRENQFWADSGATRVDRQNGCFYRGFDTPGVTKIDPKDKVEFHLEFRGAAVDHCNGDTEVSSKSNWTVDYPKKAPPPPPPPPPPVTTADNDLPEPPRIGPAPSGPQIRMPFDPTKTQISDEAFSYAQAHGSRGVDGDDLQTTIDLETRALRAWYDASSPSTYILDADNRANAYAALAIWAKRRIAAWKDGRQSLSPNER